MATERIRDRDLPTVDRPAAVRVSTRIAAPTRDGHVRVELLTDPWSVWCWGFEPVRRTLELRYPSIEFKFLLGGMFPQLPDPVESGFDVERFFSIVQRTTGMPIRLNVTKKERPTSTYPACIYVHAVRLAAPEKELRYLRALREAVYLDGKNISRPEVGAAVAASIGVDEPRFDQLVHSGEAEEAFHRQLQLVHSQGLHAYPTLLVTAGDKSTRVEGFQSLPAVLGLARALSGRDHPPRPDPPLEAVLPVGERVTTREVAEVLGVSMERAFERLKTESNRGRLRRERFPAGDAWSRVGEPAST